MVAMRLSSERVKVGWGFCLYGEGGLVESGFEEGGEKGRTYFGDDEVEVLRSAFFLVAYAFEFYLRAGFVAWLDVHLYELVLHVPLVGPRIESLSLDF